MFTLRNGVYFFLSTVDVEWVAYSLESAIAHYATAYSLTYREALLRFERSV